VGSAHCAQRGEVYQGSKSKQWLQSADLRALSAVAGASHSTQGKLEPSHCCSCW